MKAGRILLKQIHDLADKHVDFGFETTLAGRTYVSLLKKLRDRGYSIHLFFLWIPNVKLSLERIKERVSHGGHDVPARDVRRRFGRSLTNFARFYMPLLNSWFLFDNSTTKPRLIAKGEQGRFTIEDSDLFSKITQSERFLLNP